MKLPIISHLQFAVLAVLLDGDRPGRTIRDRLTKLGVRQTGPAFYQMMARLEDARLVTGWYDQKVIDGQVIKERVYRISPQGKKDWKSTREFYLRRGDAEDFREVLAHV